MFDIFQLKNLNNKPKINDISLEILREFYEKFLCPGIYRYKIITTNSERNIEVRFNTKNFCHLLGIETIVRDNVKKTQLYNYRGETGWDNIKKGLITFKELKKINKTKFQSVKAKFVYFYLIPSLLENPMAVYFDNKKVVPITKIDCEILFYSKKENAVIHLGIVKDSMKPYYVPKTFFVEKLKSGKEDIYIKNQQKLELKTIDFSHLQ